MTIRIATEADRVAWNQYVGSNQGSFLQTWAWGDFQAELGVKIWRFIGEDQGKIVAVALMIERTLPLHFSWLYIPGGPVITAEYAEEFSRLLQQQTKQIGAMFVRADVATSVMRQTLEAQGWVKSDHDVQPRHTAVLDITRSEEELLAAMHQKTRYNIRMASKKGVTIRFSQDLKDVDVFLALTREVTRRSRFAYHPDSYYTSLLDVLRKQDGAELAIAEYQGQPIAAHFMVYFAGVATYVHGASNQEHKAVMAPQLLYWETIRRAKAKGCKVYDFYGVAPEDASPAHPWGGITRMKMGFNGTRVQYEGSYDLVLKSLEYRMFQMVRRQLRGK